MELKQKIIEKINQAVCLVFGLEVDAIVTVPEPRFGDFATNVALQVAGKLGTNPKEVAEQIKEELARTGLNSEVAGPGFINIRVGDQDLWKAASARTIEPYDGLSYVVEYSCPNYFKELHAGHLYQTLYGNAIARMVEAAGATVHRTNFGADVGLSAARALWGIINHIGGENPESLEAIPINERTRFIATSYVEGAKADTSDNEAASAEIMTINKRIYIMHTEGDTTSLFAQIYFTTRQWCREYFEALYRELEVDEFEKFYPESSTEARGRKEVEEHRGDVFVDSEGAVVYEGEKDGLHTRVFITREGLPTYETKDLGLIFTELEDFAFDKRILITGKEQSEYMKVVWQAADRINPGIKAKMQHLTNGLIRFGDGKKMSSRTGNVTTAMDVIEAVREAAGKTGDELRDKQIYLGALKYEFLKYKLGGDIAFDPESSVSLHGNSGPYLQYALVRAKSILTKAGDSSASEGAVQFHEGERALVRKLSHYQMVLEEATRNYETHTLCTYLYELAGEFNVFYEKNRIIDSEREAERLRIVDAYAQTLQSGLELLGIQVPEKM